MAEAIFRMYETCAQGDTSFARQMVAHADSAVTFNSQFPVQLQTTEHDEDDDDEDMPDEHNRSGQLQTSVQAAAAIHIPSDYNTKPLFGEALKVPLNSGPVRQLGEQTEPVKETVEMDDDGFAPVKTTGRRKR